MKQVSAESILLPLQQLQQSHDEIAHRDILSFDLYKRLKHMVLHFYKYAGKIESARVERDFLQFRKVLVDTFIICMASANAMNVSLGESIQEEAEAPNLDALARELGKTMPTKDLFVEALHSMLVLGGQMAKAIESADHMERGDPRATMEILISRLTVVILGILGHLDGHLDAEVRGRLHSIEQKSIFYRTTRSGDL